MTTTMQRRIYGHATDVEIRPLNEEKAVQAAVDLIGEGFVFLVIIILASPMYLLHFIKIIKFTNNFGNEYLVIQQYIVLELPS